MAKCPICGKNRSNKKELLEHVENSHKDEIPSNLSAAQYVYSLNHDGRTYGICRICGKPTPWNEKAGKPKQICGSPSCKAKVSKEFEENLKNKSNKTRYDLMNDPDHQEKMLANRKISGVYKWSDGKHLFKYTGSYEKFAIEWLDKIMDMDPDGIQMPGPKIQYMFESKPHIWITDMYLSDYNLVIEIKDGNATGDKNTHPGFAHNRDLEKAKDEYMKSQNQYNYIKLTNKNMMQLVKILSEIRLNNIFNEDKGLKKKDPIININESTILNEAMDWSPYPMGTTLIEQIAEKVNAEYTYSRRLTWPIDSYVDQVLFANIETSKPIPVEVFKALGYSDFRNNSRSSKMFNFSCSKIIGPFRVEIIYNHLSKDNNICVHVMKKDSDTESTDHTCETCKHNHQGYDITMSEECAGCCSFNNKYEPKNESISNDDISALCEGTYEYLPEEKGVLTEASFPFFLSNKDVDKISNNAYSSHKANYSTYDIQRDTWRSMLFQKNDIVKKATSIFHKVEINAKNHTIEIRGINYLKLMQHIKNLYPDQKVHKIFEIIYNPKDWEKYKNKRINKSRVRIEYIQTYEFFALELSILFRELYNKYGLNYYNDICRELYNKTWLSNSDIIKPDNIDLDRLRLLNDRFTLKPYQKDFIEAYPTLKSRLNLNGYILSFDQGLGKTLTAVALALCLRKDKVYIVCPNALKENWALEIKSYFPKYVDEAEWKKEVYIYGISKEYDSKRVKFIIVNQESIPKIFDKVDKNCNSMLVIDESHNFRNLNSARSESLIQLKDLLNTKDVLVMSGTPIKASPNEICPVLRLIDPLFTDEVANVYNKCFNMNDIAASNIIQTRFGKIMYRKTKSEVLQLPEKHLDTLKLKVSNEERYYVLNIRQLVKARAKELYKEEYKDYEKLQKEFHDLINKYSTSSKEDINKYLKIIDENIPNYELHEMDVEFKKTYLEKYVYPRISSSPNDKNRLDFLLVRFVNMWQHCIGIALGEIMHPRRKELFIKLYDDNKAIINKMIQDNIKKTVIFTPIVEVAKHIHQCLGEAGLASVLVTGEVKDKLTPILRFKEDSNIDVLVATSQTLGTGVTLTEANLMFFFGTPWRSADFDQCCDRIYRIGQTDDVFIFNVLMDSNELNLSTRMEKILNWSNTMFDAMITSTDDETIQNLNESANIDISFKSPKELFDWMRDNIKYDHSNKLRSAQEVYDEKKGDCHDQCEFENYIFDKMKFIHGRLFIIEYSDNSKPWYEQQCGSTHTALWYIDNDKYYWFENAWEKYQGINGPYDKPNEMINDIKKKWKYSGDNKYLYIRELNKVKPGMNLNDYCMTNITLNESIDKATSICPECGSEIKVYLKGEPVYLCSNPNCNKYFGVVDFPSKNEAVMSIANLSPIVTNGLYQELKPNETNKDFEEKLNALKQSLSEAVDESSDNVTRYFPNPKDIDYNDDYKFNRIKHDIVNNKMIEETVTSHYGKLYAISDTHIFGKWDKNEPLMSIQEVNKMIDDINSVVKDNDTLLICGDIGYKKDEFLHSHTKYFLTSLHCKHIWLILGNHDLLPISDYKKFGCEKVCHRLNYNGFAFTHCPIDAPFNFHGHIHMINIRDEFPHIDPENKYKLDYRLNGIDRIDDIINSKIIKPTEDVLNEEAVYDSKHKYPIFITVMHTGTSLANIIKKFTHDDFSHVGLSLTSALDPIYSFDRKKADVSNGSGFSVMSYNDDFFKHTAPNTVYSVYVMYLTKDEFDAVKTRLQYFIDNGDSLKYDFTSLLLNYVHIPSEFSKKYFCSRFVAEAINAGRKLEKKPSLYRPNDFAYFDDVTLVNKGINLSKYNKSVTEKNLKLIQSKRYNEILLEESLKDSQFMFGNGEYSAITDNRFVDFQTGDPNEQNEDIDPYTSMFSPNNTKEIPDYFDASSNFQTNEDVRVDIETDPTDSGQNDLSSISQSIYSGNFE